MKKSAAIFLQGIVLLCSIAALSWLLWEPHLEGRNRDATPFEIYFQDPFLMCVYVASIPFFMAMFQCFRLLGLAARDQVLTWPAVRALRRIKQCAVAVALFLLGVEVWLFAVQRGREDIAGGVVIGLVLTILSLMAAAGAALLQRTLQHAVDLKLENDMTV